MNQAQAASGEPAVRTSDTERDQAAEVLRVAYAEGRLTCGELDERIGVAYAATTRADLCDLTSDLPGAIPAQRAHRRPVITDLPAADAAPGTGTGMHLDWCLPLCLLIAFPQPASSTGSWPPAASHRHTRGMRPHRLMPGLRQRAGPMSRTAGDVDMSSPPVSRMSTC